MRVKVSEKSIATLLEKEKNLYLQRNITSAKKKKKSAQNWLRGVPMHWMVDWGTPFPLFVSSAQGVDLVDADGVAGADDGALVWLVRTGATGNDTPAGACVIKSCG